MTWQSGAPGLNFRTFRAVIVIGAPVCGFRPVRARFARTSKVPKPVS